MLRNIFFGDVDPVHIPGNRPLIQTREDCHALFWLFSNIPSCSNSQHAPFQEMILAALKLNREGGGGGGGGTVCSRILVGTCLFTV